MIAGILSARAVPVVLAVAMGTVLVLMPPSPPTVSGAGPYDLPAVASITATFPAWLLAPETRANCLARFDQTGASVEMRELCYRGVRFDPNAPIGPPPYLPARHDVLSGGFDQGTGVLLLPVSDCEEFVPGLLAASFGIGIQLEKSGGQSNGSAVVTTDTAAPFDCAPGPGTTTTTGSLDFFPRSVTDDYDGDGCTDYDELGPGGTWSGPGDPFNPNDCSGPITSSGIYGILEVLEETTGPSDPGSYHRCLADVQRAGDNLTARTYCYIDTPGVPVNPEMESDCVAHPEACGDGFPGEPPPMPYGDVDGQHTQLSGSVAGGKVNITGCLEDLDGQSPLGHVYVEWEQDAATGAGTASIWTSQPAACAGSPAGSPTVAGLYATKLAEPQDNHDLDGDNCPDAAELSDTETAGGLRDPFNHWDYFNPTHDGLNRVDDILVVQNAYHIDKGDPGYSKTVDRTPLVGSNAWNFGPPNGLVRNDDILAAVKSYHHDCSGGAWVDDDTFPKPSGA